MQNYVKLLPITPLLLSGGCALEKHDSLAPAVSCGTVERKSDPIYDNVAKAQWQAKLAAQTRATDTLRLQLLIKQAEFNQLKLQHNRVIQDMQRANTRLRGMDSKADAIANIAEAALMIKRAREISEDEPQPALIHAEKLLEESRQALKSDNVSDASYLAAKASELTIPGVPTSDQEQTMQSSQAETVFTMPLVMRAIRHSNVRELPTKESNALFQLTKGSLVDALGYKDLWIRVATEATGEGWIYYRLLEAADLSGR